MARKKQTMEPAPGEQMDLLDVSPENLKEIIPVAKQYRKAVKRRMVALEEETQLKGQILNLIKDAKFSRLADGSIKFRCDGMLITVTPRDELVRVNDKEDQAA